MTFLKDLWTDLVEKRLWPVALVLLLALAAVPVALGGASDDAPVSAPVDTTGITGAASAVTQPAQIALDPGFPVRRDRGEAVRDPFAQPKVAEQGVTGVTGSADAGPPTAQGASPASSPGTGSPAGGVKPGGGGLSPTSPAGPTGPAGPPRSTPRPDPLDYYYVVALRFGRVGVKRTRQEVERLTPLPSPENPFFVYLGVLSNAKTAVFMLSSDVKATGDGTCKPRKSSCETVELRRGDTEFLERTADDGKVTRYQLDVGRITKKQSAAPSRAVAARKAAKKPTSPTRVSPDDELSSDRYKYDDETGLLRRVKRAPSLGAHLPSMGDAPGATFRGAAALKGPAALPRFLPGP